MDLPDGGSVIVDPDNYAALVTEQPPVGRDRPDDPTDVANDYLDHKDYDRQRQQAVASYKQFLGDNPDLRRGPRAPSYEDQFRAALAAGSAVPRVGQPQPNFRPQPSAADVQDLRNLAATFSPAGGGYQDRAHAALKSAGIDPQAYDEMQQTAAAMQSPPAVGGRAHVMLNYGFDDPELQEQYGEKHTGSADPSAPVEPQFNSNRKFVDQYYQKYREKDGTLSPFYQALYDNAVAKANAADDADRKSWTHDQMQRLVSQRVKDKLPAPVLRADFAIPAGSDDGAAGAAAGATVHDVGSPTGSYEDRVRAALAAAAPQGASSAPLAYSPMTEMAGAGLGVPNLLDAAKKKLMAAGMSPDDAARYAQLQVRSDQAQAPRTGIDTTDPNLLLNQQKAERAQDQSAAPGAPPETTEQNAARLKAYAQQTEREQATNDAAVMSRVEADRDAAKTGQPAPDAQTDDGETVTGTPNENQQSALDVAPRYVTTPAMELPKAKPERITQLQADTIAEGVPAQQEANAMSATARAESDLFRRMGQVESRNASESMLQEQVRRQKVDRLMSRLQEQSDAISNQNVNPDRFWESRSDGQKAALVLSAMLGGFTAGIRGGPNQALEQINKSIDNDIQAQKANIANRRSGVDTVKNELDLMRLQFGDERTAEAAVKLSRINSLKAFVDSERAKYQDPAFQARAAAIQAQLQVQADQLGIQLHQWVNPQTIQTNGLGVADDKLYVPGVNGIANTPEDAEDLKQNFLPAYDNLKRILASAERIRKANGQTDPAEIPELTSLQNEATLYINQLHRMKRMGPADKENNEGMASDFTKVIFGKAIDKNIKSFNARLDKSREAAIRNYGLVGGAQGYDITGVRRTYFTRRKVGLPDTAAPQGTGFASIGG